MEHWSAILFFAAAFISITRAEWNCDDSLLPQPNIANMSQPNFQDMPQPYDASNSKPIGVVSCEFYAKENAKAHHTEKYAIVQEKDPSPVLRRSQSFRMAILFDRPFSMDKDSVTLELTLGWYENQIESTILYKVNNILNILDYNNCGFTHKWISILKKGWYENQLESTILYKVNNILNILDYNNCGFTHKWISILKKGSNFMKKRGPPVLLPVTPKKGFTHPPANWDIIRLPSDSESSKRLTLRIQIPYTAGVGLWKMKVISKVSGGNQPMEHACNDSVFILFNPWSRGDLVYMEDDIDRQEYVLNDVGNLYTGSFDKRETMSWNFAQFQMSILVSSILILEKAPYLDFESRGDPVKVVSAISAMVNSNDEDGILEGRWDGNYTDGTPPWEWTGSEPIIRKYMESGSKPVKYGQCWVFSALATTICRALGLPCRSVSNYESATDGDNDLILKKYFHNDGSPAGKSEKPWNFHVWNECWMSTRDDLPAEFSGWQAFDGTPEIRDKTEIFRAGPASVEAVRRGEIESAHHSKVFFAATNCDIYYFTIDKENPKYQRLDRIDTRGVGKRTVTMNPSGQEHDITLTYKPREGTPEERHVYNYARKKLGRNIRFVMDPAKRKEDVCFNLRLIHKIMIGKKFKMFFDIANNSLKKRTISLTTTINSVYYHGAVANKVKSDKRKVILQPSQKKTLVFEVGPNIYLDKLVELCMLRVYVHASVFETNQTWATEDNFQFSKPPLQIEYLDMTIRPKLLKPVEVSFSFTNPLNVTLKDCAIVMEGLGLIEYGKTELGDLGPGEALTHIEIITPKKVGSHRLSAVLTSHLIVKVLGSKQLEVEEV